MQPYALPYAACLTLSNGRQSIFKSSAFSGGNLASPGGVLIIWISCLFLRFVCCFCWQGLVMPINIVMLAMFYLVLLAPLFWCLEPPFDTPF